MLDAPILILGAPRSGTTWLAKIIDSHPEVLYRHEPDDALPAPAGLTADGLRPLLESWVADHSPKTVTKRPFFPKAWQPGWARLLRSGYAAAAGMAGLKIPDFSLRTPGRVAIKSVRWAEGAAILARTLPDSRTIFILRHPAGQVASVMRGNRQRRFDLNTAGTDMPFDEDSALRLAGAHGVSGPAFQALPDAAKYAWAWRAFNEPTYAVLAPERNVHVVLYEALCAQPEVVSRRIMKFADLSWDPQTEDFVARSTEHQGEAGYYAIFRNAVAAAEAWRTTMPLADQDAVRQVVASSPLARFWPDLVV